MSMSQTLAPHLPYLRRYARALTGTQASGDTYVRAALSALLAGDQTLTRSTREAGVEPACFGFKAQRGCRQPTARVLDQAAGIGPAWAAFRAQLGCQQPTPE